MSAGKFLLLCLVTWGVEASPVRISPSQLMVREGDNVTLSCSSKQDWFFCLWRHPQGEKECSVQEAGHRRSVCKGGGEERMEVRSTRRHCDLDMVGVRREDQGGYMCMMTQSDNYNTHQLWLQLEVAVPDTISLHLVNMDNITDNTVEMVEGETLEVVCGGGGGYPAAQYSWLVEEQIINTNTLNFTARSLQQSGTNITCLGVQHNRFTGEVLFTSSLTITVIVLPAPALYLGLISQSSSSLITLSFVAAVLITLTVSLLAIFLIRRRKSPPPSLSEESGVPSPIWTTKCPNKRAEINTEILSGSAGLMYQQKYLHPLSPSYMVTSTPVRTDHSQLSHVVNMSHYQQETSGLESFSQDHNQSIGDIVQGNFVSFSTSDLYCVSDGEVSDKTDKQGEKGEAIEEDDLLGSLCEKCRSSFCSSSTLTLTPESESCPGSNLSETRTINVEDIISICESLATLETEDGGYDVAISDEIDIDTLEGKTNTNVSDSQDNAECSS